MKIKFVGIFIVVAFLAACSSKQAVATTPTPASPAVVETVTTVEEVKPVAAIITPEEIEKGHTLYDNHCANCHKLYSPTAYTEQKWIPIMARMQRKARLDDAQMATIMNYVTSELNKK